MTSKKEAAKNKTKKKPAGKRGKTTTKAKTKTPNKVPISEISPDVTPKKTASAALEPRAPSDGQSYAKKVAESIGLLLDLEEELPEKLPEFLMEILVFLGTNRQMLVAEPASCGFNLKMIGWCREWMNKIDTGSYDRDDQTIFEALALFHVARRTMGSVIFLIVENCILDKHKDWSHEQQMAMLEEKRGTNFISGESPNVEPAIRQLNWFRERFISQFHWVCAKLDARRLDNRSVDVPELLAVAFDDAMTPAQAVDYVLKEVHPDQIDDKQTRETMRIALHRQAERERIYKHPRSKSPLYLRISVENFARRLKSGQGSNPPQSNQDPPSIDEDYDIS